MSILGIVIRVRPIELSTVRVRLAGTAGVDLGPDQGDGRLAAVIESTAAQPAATTMGEIAQWPEVINLSLVYEHSEPESALAPTSLDFRAWRGDVGDFARRQAQSSVFPASTSATPAQE